MLILITTKYHGPTNTKPARVSATLQTLHSRPLPQHRVTVGFHSASACPHDAAVRALIEQLRQHYPEADPYSTAGMAILAPAWHRTAAGNATGYTYGYTTSRAYLTP